MSEPIHLFKQYAKERYGEPIFRIPLDLGFGCPNRESDGSGGCTFCAEEGGRAVQLSDARTLRGQVERGISFARKRYGAKKFMAYFQAHTNTQGTVAELRKLYRELLALYPFDAVSIGTRPDCLPPAVLDLLAELNEETEVWIDLGIQTVHNQTLRRIKRGHDWETAKRAIDEIADRGLRTAAHIIVGLPGESDGDCRETVETLASLPIHGIKIHNLHVLKGTRLAADFRESPFPVFDEYEYGEILMDLLRRIPSDLTVMRMTTDNEPERVLAPRWIMKKGQFADYIRKQMILREWRQGDLHVGDGRSYATLDMDPVETQDGSITFYNPDFNEHYHSPAGARSEAEQKYIAPSKLAERIQCEDVRLLDICFGLGYNSLSACETALHAGGRHNLSITALEMDRRAVGMAARKIGRSSGQLLDWPDCLNSLYSDAYYTAGGIEIRMEWGDARYTARRLEAESFDIVFLDAFSTQRNSQLWTLDFFRRIRGVMKADGILATYCAALPVRGGLMQAGFHLGESVPFGRKRGSTIATLRESEVDMPLEDEEVRRIARTTRGLPYRDPRLCWSNRKILRQREKARRNSTVAVD